MKTKMKTIKTLKRNEQEAMRIILCILRDEVTCGKTMKGIVKDFNLHQKKRNDRLTVAKMMTLCSGKRRAYMLWRPLNKRV